MYKGNLKVLSNQKIAIKTFSMHLEVPSETEDASPGQFVNLRLIGEYSPFLRRPFSIASATNGSIEIIYKVVGRGTWHMSTLETGDAVDTLGPIGNGYSFQKNESEKILIGGGIGIPPLIFLKRVMMSNGITPVMLAGARAINEHYYNDTDCPVYYATDDGSKGYSGLVTDILEERLKEGKADSIFACGPNPMLKRVSEIASEYEVDCQLAVETVFGCGTGLCLGCIISTSKDYHNESGQKYLLVCKDGPVFDSREISFESI